MRRQPLGGPGPTKLNIKRSCEQSIIKFFLSYTFSMKSSFKKSVDFLIAADPRHLKLAADEQQVGWAVTEGPNNHHN